MPGGLHVGVERIGCGHVGEVRATGCVNGPAFGQHRYLGELAANGIVVRAEAIVRVARHNAMTGQVYGWIIKVIGWVDVFETDVTRSLAWRGGERGRGRGTTACVMRY